MNSQLVSLARDEQMYIVTQRGIRLGIREVPNVLVFNAIANSDNTSKVIEPKVPMYYIDEQDKWVENPHHPLYHDALNVYATRKELVIFDTILHMSILFDDYLLEKREWKEYYDLLQLQGVLPIYTDERISYLKYFALTSDIDKGNLTKNVLLTESLVYRTFNSIHVTRDAQDIHTAPLRNSVDTNIEIQPIIIGGEQLVNPLDEYLACTESNMNWVSWIRCEYSLPEKAATMALYRLNKIRDIHSDDAVQIQVERKNKTK